VIRKLSRSKQRDLADGLFSRFIRARDGHCLACGNDVLLQCAHIISRSYHAIRFDPLNAVALCRGCHVRYTHRPLEWEVWAREWIGDEAYDQLRIRAMAHEKVDYDEVLNWLRAEAA
jgi:5-methylcytosine-specific restriction endonuclease McrA